MERKYITYLNHFVVTGRNDGDRVIISFFVWNNSDLGNPVIVTQQSGQTLTFDGPDLDGLVTGTRDNHGSLLVNVNGHNIGLVTDESLVGFTGGNIP